MCAKKRFVLLLIAIACSLIMCRAFSFRVDECWKQLSLFFYRPRSKVLCIRPWSPEHFLREDRRQGLVGTCITSHGLLVFVVTDITGTFLDHKQQAANHRHHLHIENRNWWKQSLWARNWFHEHRKRVLLGMRKNAGNPRKTHERLV